MKKEKISCLLCFLFTVLVFFSSSAKAAGEIKDLNIQVTLSSQLVEISGQVAEAKSFQQVTVEVLRPGKTLPLEKPYYEAPLFDTLEYIDTISTDQNGRFSLTAGPFLQSGKYTVRIRSGMGADSPAESSFYLISIEQAKQDIAYLNSRQGILDQRAKEIIERYLAFSNEKVLGAIRDKAEIYNQIMKKSDYDVNKPEEFVVLLENTAITAAVNQSRAETILSLLKDSDDGTKVLAVSPASDLFLRLKNKTAVVGRLVGRNFKEYQNFTNGFHNAVVLAAVKDVENWKQIEEVLKTAKEFKPSLITIDSKTWADFQTLNDKYAVLNGIYIATFDSCADLTRKFAELVKKELSPKDGDTSSGSGQGNGSKGATGGSKGDYVFENPKNNKTEQPNGSSFNDMEQYSWAAESVDLLFKKGIIAGKGSGRFEPQAEITREEFVKLLVTAFGLSADSKTGFFSDVPREAWYHSYVVSAVSSGIVKGISEETFGVGQPVTRQDMAALIYRILQKKGLKVTAEQSVTLSDFDQISEYAKEAVNAMNSSKLILGDENSCFQPKNYASRAEASVIIHRTLKALGLI